MAININSIYGTESTWLSLYEDTAKIKLATFQGGTFRRPYYTHTLGAGRMSGVLDEIDKSICPIAVDSNSSMVNVKYAGFQSGNEEPIELYGTPQGSALMYVSCADNSNHHNCLGASYLTDNESYNNTWLSDKTDSGFPSTLTSLAQPIAEWGYRGTIGVINVWLAKDLNDMYNSDNIGLLDLYTYVNTPDFQTMYPYVLCVVFTPCRWTWQNTDKTIGAYFPSNFGTDYVYNYPESREQTFCNFGVIPIGSASTFTTPDGKERKYVYHRNVTIPTYIQNNYTYVSNLNPVLGGYGNGYTGDLYNSTNRFIPVYGADKFTVTYADSTRKDRLFSYWRVTDFAEFNEWCLKQASYLGMFFSDSYSFVVNGSSQDSFFTNDHMYMGIIDGEGITHGEYVQGKGIEKYDQSKWDSLKNQSPYDYTKGVDNSIYDDETKLNTGRLQTVGTAFSNIYACSLPNTQQLKTYLYSAVAPEATSETLTKNFLTVNPIDCIVSCMQFPFEVPHLTGSSTPIALGNTTAKTTLGSNIEGYQLSDGLAILDFGTIEYFAKFGDFRDYEPYTEGLLYIPYAGYTPISPADFIGQKIGIKMICDLITGACTALVYRNGLVIQTINGTIGVQVPITGIMQADYANSVHRASTQLKSATATTAISVMGAIGSLATKNPVGAVMGMGQFELAEIQRSNAQYELQHTKVPFKTSGVSSPACDFDNEQTARLILKRPVMDSGYNAEIYGHTVGFACCLNTTLGSVSGYTVCNEAKIGGAATAEEKQMIENLLKSGVYL